MKILITGAAGFIGFHISQKLLKEYYQIIGIDNMNDYYDPSLKQSRIEILGKYNNFNFHKVDLKDRVVIVTGGGGAIGSAMCRQFAANGAKVVAAGRTLATLEKVAEEVRAAGGEAVAVVADVGNKESAAEMIEKTVEIYGKLDVLVNNAGINGGPEHRKPIHEYDDDLWHRIINVDLNGVYYCSKPAIKQMEKQGTGGSIINIGSIIGFDAAASAVRVYGSQAGVST